MVKAHKKFTILTSFKHTVSSVKYIRIAVQHISTTSHLAELNSYTHPTRPQLPLAPAPGSHYATFCFCKWDF